MATMDKVVLCFLFLLSAGVQGGEGVQGDGEKLEVRTNEADAEYMARLAAATGADRELKWDGDPCNNSWSGVSCNGDGRVVSIDLTAQGLAGWVPGNGGDALSRLTQLDLRNNTFSGPLPELVVPLLQALYLDNNLFTIMPPRFFAGMRKLEVFSISNNTFLQGWSLPVDLRSLTELWKLQASNAGINGTLQDLLTGNNTAFSFLDLANNNLTGPVPETFASERILSLDLSNNSLTGPISFVEHLPYVSEVLLDRNNFTGPLPAFDEHMLPNVFSVAHNRLTGVVPASLTHILSPGSVSLSGNMLQGPVPEFARGVQNDVADAAETGSFCRLDPGPCDPEVDSLLSIAEALHFPVILAASWRRNDPCAGWIGVHCGKLDDKKGGNRRVTGINLSRMALNGTIHPAFASLLSLEAIVLSGNNISGVIPQALAQLPSLRILDVSDNTLEGSMLRFGRGVEVWAEGNPELNISSVSPPSMPEQRYTLAFVVVMVIGLVL